MSNGYLSFRVEGMVCGSCTSAVKGALDAVDGVYDATVGLDGGAVV